MSDDRPKGLDAARRDTVRIVNMADPKKRGPGQGLLVRLDEAGPVILTCWHVIAEIPTGEIGVEMVGADGRFGVPRPVRLDEAASIRECDVAVLRLATGSATPGGLVFHEVQPRSYNGSLPVIVITHETADTFNARLGPRSPSIDLDETYRLSDAFRLVDAGETARGISGSPVWCDGGVLGLVHAARDESATRARVAFMCPLRNWTAGLPELTLRLRPFASESLTMTAAVLRADDGELDVKLSVKEPVQIDYVHRKDLEDRARQLLEQERRVYLVGRPGSGKSRMLRELARAIPDSLVLIPRKTSPPFDPGERSSFVDRPLIIAFDNLHQGVVAQSPEAWLRAADQLTRHALFIATCDNDAEWQRVKERSEYRTEDLEQMCVYLSAAEGHDLDRDAGWEIARQLGLSDAEFNRRFDGSPASIVRERPSKRGVPAGRATGVALERRVGSLGVGVPNNLPRFSSPLVGRDVERADVAQLVASGTLVTVTGPPAAGKSRLSLQVAVDVAAAFADGVWAVDLSFLESHDLILSAVTRELKVPDAPLGQHGDAIGRIAAHLRGQAMLIGLNGCDGDRRACARLVERILKECPSIAILATSRAPLGAVDEKVYEIPPLSTSSDERSSSLGSDAVRLFLDRVDELHPGTRFSSGVPAVAALCSAVAGNPLAIELAATLVERLSLDTITRRFVRARGRRSAKSAASQSAILTAAVDSVSDTLTAPQRSLFGVLGVFAGSFNVDAAAAIAAPVVDPEATPALLRELVDRQLVLIDARSEGQQRFRQLEAMRQHSLRLLDGSGRVEAIRRRHAERFVELASTAARHRNTWEEAVWLDRLDAEIDNLDAALSWCVEAGERRLALRAGAALWWFWSRRGYYGHGQLWLGRVLDLPIALADVGDLATTRASALDRAEVQNGAANLAYNLGQYAAAEALQLQCLETRTALGERGLTAGSLNNLGLVARRRGRTEEARRLFSAAIDISREVDNEFWEAIQLNNLGILLQEWDDDRAEALACQETSLQIFTRHGSDWGTGMVLAQIASLRMDANELDDVDVYLERSLELRQRVGTKHGIAHSQNGVGRLCRLLGRREAAADHHLHALGNYAALGHRPGIAETLEALALIEWDDALSAVWQAGAGAGIRAAIGAPLPPVPGELLHRRLAAARAQVRSDAAYEATYEQGRTSTLEEVVEMMLRPRSATNEQSRITARESA